MSGSDSHYFDFSEYVSKPRWSSFWHQLDELHRLRAKSVLEVGPGPGILTTVAARFGINVETVDVDPAVQPDHVAPASALPFPDSSYAVVCAFQVLEHMPYEQSLRAFGEFVRVARDHVLLSLPDAKTAWRYLFHIPRVGRREFLVERPMQRLRKHVFDGQHFWEVNKQHYPLSKIVRDFSVHARMVRTYRVNDNPFHRFFLFRKEPITR